MSCCSVFCSVITCMTLVMASPRKRVLSNFDEKKKAYISRRSSKMYSDRNCKLFYCLVGKTDKKENSG